MFEKASRLKLRFNTPIGQISVEDLWDIPLTSTTNKPNLDDIAKELYRKTKESSEESFVTSNNKGEISQFKLDIVKHIIKVRLDENALALTAKQNKEKKQQILQLIAQKQNEQLAGSSLEDLMKMAEAL